MEAPPVERMTLDSMGSDGSVPVVGKVVASALEVTETGPSVLTVSDSVVTLVVAPAVVSGVVALALGAVGLRVSGPELSELDSLEVVASELNSLEVVAPELDSLGIETSEAESLELVESDLVKVVSPAVEGEVVAEVDTVGTASTAVALVELELAPAVGPGGTMTVTSRTIVVTDPEVDSSTGFDSAIVSLLVKLGTDFVKGVVVRVSIKFVNVADVLLPVSDVSESANVEGGTVGALVVIVALLYWRLTCRGK